MGATRGYEGPEEQNSNARGTFVRLTKTWSSNNVSRRTKLRLYKTLVVPVLPFTAGCEAWKMNKGDNKAVDVFQNTPAYEGSSEFDGKNMLVQKSY